MSGKLLTIVIPSYNQGEYIERTLLSVLSQKSEDVEVFVIDGDSSDGAVEIIKAYADRLDYWVSEPDRGQSHAFNKGFKRANGHYLTWVNSDDILLPGAIDAFRKFAKGKDNLEWVAGHSAWVDVDDKLLRCTFNPGWSDFSARRGLLSVSGPASIFSKAIWQRVGGFDESLHYSMDTDLWYRFASRGAKYELLNHHIWALRIHPEAKVSGKDFSADQRVVEKIANERAQIQKKYGFKSPSLVEGVIAKMLRLRRLAKLRSAYWTRKLKGCAYQELMKFS